MPWQKSGILGIRPRLLAQVWSDLYSASITLVLPNCSHPSAWYGLLLLTFKQLIIITTLQGKYHSISQMGTRRLREISQGPSVNKAKTRDIISLNFKPQAINITNHQSGAALDEGTTVVSMNTDSSFSLLGLQSRRVICS